MTLKRKAIIGVSGGPDSVYMLRTMERGPRSLVIAHVNHGARAEASDGDQFFVEGVAADLGLPLEVLKEREGGSTFPNSGFENRAREARYTFFKKLMDRHRCGKSYVAHTADDQVETILMRIIEGAGISGLKGIPRRTAEGIERPLLDTWREDILEYLQKHKVSYRVDKSNIDTRFERNWIRHVLIPLLEKRYGKSVKKRIFALGERFREIDDFLEITARGWMKRNVKATDAGSLCFQRKSYGALPAALRKKILQIISFERIGVSANERLLESMDRILVSAGPSAGQNIGKGAVLRCRYDHAILEIGETGKRAEIKKGKTNRVPMELLTEEKGKLSSASIKRLAKGEQAAAFDGDGIRLPLAVRPLKTGDRIRPFGLDAEKKVKEILIDRKVPRDERWGRPVVCDAKGTILWIPGVVRSGHAPVTGKTRHTAVLRVVRM